MDAKAEAKADVASELETSSETIRRRYRKQDVAFVLIGAAVFAYLEIAPFTKVEESFNLHAAYDFLKHPLQEELFDHKTFPGAVPRSFIGSFILSMWSYPYSCALDWVLADVKTRLKKQCAVRLVLGLMNVTGLVVVSDSVEHRFGAGVFFTLFTATQFHVPFYASRTLSNMIAFPFVNVALSLMIGGDDEGTTESRSRAAIGWLVVAAVIFRAEVALLLAPVALQMLVRRDISFFGLLMSGLLSAVGAILFTVFFDTVFWTWPTLLWPELYSVYFNVYQGKSAEWGVSPPWEYALKHVPKLTTFALPLALYAAAIDGRAARLLVPAAAFVAAMSGLAHKEWRFVVYVVPFVNVAAAVAASSLWRARANKRVQLLLRAGLVGVFGVSAATSGALAYVSSLNYPGGHALAALHAHVPDSPPAHVHICNKAAQTGASLFTFKRESLGWVYNRTEGLAPADVARGAFTHAVVEDWSAAAAAYAPGAWTVLAEIPAFSGVRFDGWRPRVATETQLWILERNA